MQEQLVQIQELEFVVAPEGPWCGECGGWLWPARDGGTFCPDCGEETNPPNPIIF